MRILETRERSSPRFHLRRFVGLTLLLALVALALTACSGGGGEKPAATSGQGQTTSQGTPAAGQATTAAKPTTSQGTPAAGQATTAAKPTTTPTTASQARRNVDLSKPCSLLTKAEATAALGEPVEDGKEFSGSAPGIESNASACAYEAVSSTRSVKIDIADFSGSPQNIQAFKQLFPNREQVSGIGDQAWWYQNEGGPVQRDELQVFKGNTFFDVKVFKGSGNPDSEATKTVAKIVAGRLP